MYLFLSWPGKKSILAVFGLQQRLRRKPGSVKAPLSFNCLLFAAPQVVYGEFLESIDKSSGHFLPLFVKKYWSQQRWSVELSNLSDPWGCALSLSLSSRPIHNASSWLLIAQLPWQPSLFPACWIPVSVFLNYPGLDHIQDVRGILVEQVCTSSHSLWWLFLLCRPFTCTNLQHNTVKERQKKNPKSTIWPL